MFSKKLIELRKIKGWSRPQLASAVGITKEAVGMYERGQREPYLATAKALAKALEVSLDELAEMHDEDLL